MVSIPKDKVKYLLSFVAVDRLVVGDGPFTLQQLFDPKDGMAPSKVVSMVESLPTDTVRDVLKSRRWRVSLMDRLVEAGLAEKDKIDGSVVYAAYDKETLSAILVEEANNLGTSLKHFLFPKDYDLSDAIREKVQGPDAERIPELEESELEEEEDEEAGSALAELISFQTTLLSSVQEVLQSNSALAEKLMFIRTGLLVMGEDMKQTRAELASVKDALVALGPPLDALNTNIKESRSAVESMDKRVNLLDGIQQIRGALLISTKAAMLINTAMEALKEDFSKVDNTHAAVELLLEELDGTGKQRE